MNWRLKTTIAALPILLVLGCNKGPNSGESADGQNTVALDSTPVVKENWYRVAYDDVRMRETPGMDGKVVVTLKAGTKLKDTGERSAEETTVKLRGEDVTSTWYKMETESGKIAWIFGGTVEPSTPPAAKSSASILEGKLKELDAKDCSSIMRSINTFKKTANGMSPQDVDGMAPVLEDFLGKCVGKAQTELDKMPDADDLLLLAYNPDKKAISQKLKDKAKKWESCGMKLIYPEGMPTLMLSPGLIHIHLGALFSPAVKKYFAQMKVEEEEGYSEDGGLTIPIQKVAERAVFWDAWLKENAGGLYADIVELKLEDYTSVLITGLDNTPAFDYEAKAVLNPDFKKTYEWMLKNHPDTRPGKTVREFYDILKASNFEKSAKAEEFIQKIWN